MDTPSQPTERTPLREMSTSATPLPPPLRRLLEPGFQQPAFSSSI